MKTLIVYFSKFGNTQKIAEAIADVLSVKGTARAVSVDQFTAADLNALDLVVMGSPTHRMNLPEPVQSTLEALPRRILRHTRIAAFDTSYKMSWWLAYFTAARKLAQRLRKLGGKQVVPPETFRVIERQGPLYDGEIERAKAWAETILNRAARQRV